MGRGRTTRGMRGLRANPDAPPLFHFPRRGVIHMVAANRLRNWGRHAQAA